MDDLLLQAIAMGIVQGLTEFLPVSSSGHLIVVPALLGWDDRFIRSLAFSVILHLGTLGALLAYFRRDWLRLVPAGLDVLRFRSVGDDPDRRLALLVAVATVPALVFGAAFNEAIEEPLRRVGVVALALVLGAAILWLAERVGRRRHGLERLTVPQALGIGVAQAAALVPGISRSGISIAAGLFAGLERTSAARFSFLMAAPVTAAAGAFETVKLVASGGLEATYVGPLLAGLVTSFVAGLLAIGFLLRFLARFSVGVFVAYRVALAAIVVVVYLG
ncbi:MAG TPA: undecaprenyl-diphosphatase UppP [Candidatus Limnocylindrales bacterium]|nr:undecaprenyl-diphosphatase UppP [Candidatus Limnocylindrales bacterium]